MGERGADVLFTAKHISWPKGILRFCPNLVGLEPNNRCQIFFRRIKRSLKKSLIEIELWTLLEAPTNE